MFLFLNAVLCSVFVVTTLPAFQSPRPLSGHIEMIVARCHDANATDTPSVWVANGNGDYTLSHALVKESNGAFRVLLTASSVHFWLRINLGPCVDYFPTTVLPGHTRHLYALPAKFTHLTFEADRWIAGTIPPGVSNVSAFQGGGWAVAAIDDGCYYLELLPKGRYMVRFSIGYRNFSKSVDLREARTETGALVDVSESEIINGMAR